MKKNFALLFLLFVSIVAQAASYTITNNTFWKTVKGDYIFSQGGGIFRFADPKTGKEHYYWYGVKYQEAVDYAPKALAGSKSNVTNFISVTCYQSDDLVNWTFVKDVITTKTMNGHDYAWWFGRLGVAYVKDAKKYAIFVQYNDKEGVFTCDTPTGDFVYHQQIDMTSYIGTTKTGDQTVFTDDDGQSYLCYSYGNGRSRIYLSKIGVKDGKVGLVDVNQIYKGTGREGDCMFKYKGKYYVCASDLFGWNASNVYYLESSSIYGPYTPTNNMQIMPGSDADYGHVTQTGFFYTVKGSKQETVLYCGDRWAGFAGNGNGFNQWCPLSFVDGKPYFNSLSQWSLDASTGEWTVGTENNYVRNFSFDADRVKIPSASRPTQAYLKGWQFQVIKGNEIAVGATDAPQLNASNSSSDRETVMGNWSMSIYDKVAYTRKCYQKIASTPVVTLPDGKYRLTAYVKSGSKFATLYMYATSNGKTTKADISYSDSQWHQIVINDVEVKNGAAEVGFYADGAASDWARVDNVYFVKTGDLEITGDATLTKHGYGSSNQKVLQGDSIVDFYYNWTNATGVKVSGLPNGISASIDKASNKVNISGIANDEPGDYTYTIQTEGGKTDSTIVRTITITSPIVTSVAGTIANTGIEVYPNPTSGLVCVTLPSANSQDIEVYNMAGQMLMRIPADKEPIVQIELPEQEGFYLLKIQTDGDIVFNKIIKK